MCHTLGVDQRCGKGGSPRKLQTPRTSMVAGQKRASRQPSSLICAVSSAMDAFRLNMTMAGKCLGHVHGLELVSPYWGQFSAVSCTTHLITSVLMNLLLLTSSPKRSLLASVPALPLRIASGVQDHCTASVISKSRHSGQSLT